MTDKLGNVVKLHERSTVTFSPVLSALIEAEMERQFRKLGRSETVEEIAKYAVRRYCEAMAR
jgi:hypothetical protein